MFPSEDPIARLSVEAIGRLRAAEPEAHRLAHLPSADSTALRISLPHPRTVLHCSGCLTVGGIEPMPNWWRRFWYWALLGWWWEEVERPGTGRHSGGRINARDVL